jgi:tetratricopeptide (TPR) repeat protein
MVKGKRITKKQLKEPDEFITLTERAFIFIRKHSKKVAGGGILFLVLILAFIVFQMWDKKKEEEAAREFGVATGLYERGIAQAREGSIQGDKDILAKFDEVITRFPRTSSGRFSLLYKGNVYLKRGEFDEAIKAYTAFLDKSGKERLYRYFAWEGLGHAYEGKKDYAKSLEAYQKIVEVGEGYQLAEANLNIGYCYDKLGKSKEALESFKAFLSSNPKSSLSNVVLRKVSLLEKQ